MVLLLFVTAEVSPKAFILFINIIDIILYFVLNAVLISYIRKDINYVFPVILYFSFLLYSIVSLYSSLKKDKQNYKLAIYYAYMRSYMNFVSILATLFSSCYIFFKGKSLGFFFKICLLFFVFEVVLDIYWTVQLRKQIEIIQENNKLEQRRLPQHSSRGSQSTPDTLLLWLSKYNLDFESICALSSFLRQH